MPLKMVLKPAGSGGKQENQMKWGFEKPLWVILSAREESLFY